MNGREVKSIQETIKTLRAMSQKPEGLDQQQFDAIHLTSLASTLTLLGDVYDEVRIVKKRSIGVFIWENKFWSALIITASIIVVNSIPDWTTQELLAFLISI